MQEEIIDLDSDDDFESHSKRPKNLSYSPSDSAPHDDVLSPSLSSPSNHGNNTAASSNRYNWSCEPPTLM